MNIILLEIGDSTSNLVSIDNLLTILVTITLFFLGYRFSRRLDEKKENERLKNLERYFNVLIGVLHEPLTSQAEKLEKYSKQIVENKQQNLVLPYLPSFNLTQLKSINNQDLFEIFASKKIGTIQDRVKDFQIILDKIEYFDQVKQSLVRDMEHLDERLSKYSSTYGENIGIISKFLDNQASDLYAKNTDLTQDKFMYRIHLIKEEWMKNDRFPDIYISCPNFIEKLHLLCQDTPGDKRADFVLEHTMDCILAFQNYVHAKKFYSETFARYSKEMLEGWDKLSAIMKKYPLQG